MIVVVDESRVAGKLAESTEDWFAQDIYGNVWYFGEISQQFRNGELVSLDGSWKAGVDGAQPGIAVNSIVSLTSPPSALMPIAIRVGDSSATRAS